MDWYHGFYEGRERFENEQEIQAYRRRQRALTRPEVDALVRLLDLRPGARILDAYCGNGRHAVELARYGFRVTGVDIAFSRVKFAEAWARAESIQAAFFIGDVRAPGVRRVFDAVLVLGGSFTHLLDDDDNIHLLERFRALLKADGTLLIDNPNPLRFWRLRNPGATRAQEAAVRYFDLPLGIGEVSGHVRYHTVSEMKRLLERARFRVLAAYGDRSGAAYRAASPRLIVLCRAPRSP